MGHKFDRHVLFTPGVAHVNPDSGSLICSHLYQRTPLTFTSENDVNIESVYLLDVQESHVTGQ